MLFIFCTYCIFWMFFLRDATRFNSIHNFVFRQLVQWGSPVSFSTSNWLSVHLHPIIPDSAWVCKNRWICVPFWWTRIVPDEGWSDVNRHKVCIKWKIHFFPLNCMHIDSTAVTSNHYCSDQERRGSVHRCPHSQKMSLKVAIGGLNGGNELRWDIWLLQNVCWKSLKISDQTNIWLIPLKEEPN